MAVSNGKDFSLLGKGMLTSRYIALKVLFLKLILLQ